MEQLRVLFRSCLFWTSRFLTRSCEETSGITCVCAGVGSAFPVQEFYLVLVAVLFFSVLIMNVFIGVICASWHRQLSLGIFWGCDSWSGTSEAGH